MIADILVELAWKSTIVAAAVVALLAVMRRQEAQNRAAIGGLGVALLLLLPLVVLVLALSPVTGFGVVAPMAAAEAPMPLAFEPGATMLPFSAAPEAAAADPWMSTEGILASIWGAGAIFVLLRLAAGLVTLHRWTERAEVVRSPAWQSLLRTSGVPESTLLLVSADVAAPLSWGWRMPVILIDRETLVQTHEAEAVIAHEAAHLTRGDWPRLLAARLVVALFWFNPLVWLLERLYLQAVEESADAEATRKVAPAHYAQVLLNTARNAAVPLGANSMTSGALSKRIREVLRSRGPSRWSTAWRVGALASVAAVAAPVAAIELVRPSAPVAPTTPVAVPAPPAPMAPAAPATPVAMAAAMAPVTPVAPMPPVAPAAPAPRADDLAAIGAALAAAQAGAATGISEAEREALRVAAAEAARAAREAGAHARVVARDAHQIAARAQAEARVAMANARVQMRRGADDMERGAIDMRRGAAQMREEARRLRDPAYRAQQIARARERGDHVPTDQELIDAIPKMEEGARRMDEGVEQMREGARKMRQQAANE